MFRAISTDSPSITTAQKDAAVEAKKHFNINHTLILAIDYYLNLIPIEQRTGQDDALASFCNRLCIDNINLQLLSETPILASSKEIYNILNSEKLKQELAKLDLAFIGEPTTIQSLPLMKQYHAEAEKANNERKGKEALQLCRLANDAFPGIHITYGHRGDAFLNLKNWREAYINFHIAQWQRLQYATQPKRFAFNMDIILYNIKIRNALIELRDIDQALMLQEHLNELIAKQSNVEALVIHKLKDKAVIEYVDNAIKTQNADMGAFLLEVAQEISADEDFSLAQEYINEAIKKGTFDFKDTPLDKIKDQQKYSKVQLKAFLFKARLHRTLKEDKEAEETLLEAKRLYGDSEKIKNRLNEMKESHERSDVEKKTELLKKKPQERKKEILKTPPVPIESAKPKIQLSPQEITGRVLEKLIDAVEKNHEAFEKEQRKIERKRAEEERLKALAEAAQKKEASRKARNKKHSKRKPKPVSSSSTLVATPASTSNSRPRTPLPEPATSPKVTPPVSGAGGACLMTSAIVSKKIERKEEKKPAEEYIDFTDIKNFPVAHKGFYLQPFEREIMEAFTAIGKQVYLVGGSVRERMRDFILDRPAQTSIERDRDFVVPASVSAEEIMRVLGSKFEVKPSKKPNLFHCYAQDQYGNKYRIEIFRSTHNTIGEDSKNRDYTCNSLYVNHRGEVCDPTGRGIADIEENNLYPTLSGFRDDPWRIVRGLELSTNYKMNVSPQLFLQMKKEGLLLRSMNEYHSLYAWMMKSFSHIEIFEPGVEKFNKKFNFLVENEIFLFIFNKASTDKILHNIEWVKQALQDPRVMTRQQIFMIFYVCIEMQTPKSDPLLNSRKEIFDANPIFADVFKGYSKFEMMKGILQADFLRFSSSSSTSPGVSEEPKKVAAPNVIRY